MRYAVGVIPHPDEKGFILPGETVPPFDKFRFRAFNRPVMYIPERDEVEYVPRLTVYRLFDNFQMLPPLRHTYRYILPVQSLVKLQCQSNYFVRFFNNVRRY